MVRTLCIFFSSLFTSSCVPVLWPFIYIHCTLFSYMMMMYVFFLHVPPHVLFLFYLYTYVSLCTQVSHMMPWWVLFKCFRNTGCESLSCHELFSYKVFQESVVGIDLLCNTTSGYEFSDLRLLSWLFILLWFCHGLLKGKIVRDIFYVIG